MVCEWLWSPQEQVTLNFIGRLGVPPWSLSLSKNYRDFELSFIGILVFRGTLCSIRPIMLTPFRPIPTYFKPFCRADLTYFHLFRPIFPGGPDLFSPIWTYLVGTPKEGPSHLLQNWLIAEQWILAKHLLTPYCVFLDSIFVGTRISRLLRTAHAELSRLCATSVARQTDGGHVEVLSKLIMPNSAAQQLQDVKPRGNINHFLSWKSRFWVYSQSLFPNERS